MWPLKSTKQTVLLAMTLLAASCSKKPTGQDQKPELPTAVPSSTENVTPPARTSAPTAQGELKHKETTLEQINVGEIDKNFVISPTGYRYARAIARDGKWHVTIDGVKGPQFDNVGPPAFNATGEHCVYGASRDGRNVVILNGKEHPTFDRLLSPPVFSQNGKSVAYVVKTQEGQAVVFNGTAGVNFEGILKDSLVVGHDGTHWAYAAGKGGKTVLVFDRREVVLNERVERGLKVHPDSKRWIFWRKAADGWIVVSDRGESRAYEQLGDAVFSGDGTRVAWGAGRHGKQFYVVDGTEDPEFDGLSSELFFSPNGQRFAYSATNGQLKHVVVDGVKHPAYDNIGQGSLVFSPDSRNLAYVARRGQQQIAVLNGAEGEKCDGIYANSFHFSPDGKRFAYAAMINGKNHVVIDREKGPAYDEVRDITFSPDGNRLAYVAKTSLGELVVVDGIEGNAYESVESGSLRVSPDSKHLAFFALDGEPTDGPLMKQEQGGRAIVHNVHLGNHRIVVVDGLESAEFQVFDIKAIEEPSGKELGSFKPTLSFTNPNIVSFLTLKPEEQFLPFIVRVEVSVPN